MPLSNARKRELKARAQTLEPVLKVGRSGLSDMFLRSVDEALTQHGLIKIRFADFQEQRKELAPEIAARSGSELVTLVGHVAVFYREKASPRDP